MFLLTSSLAKNPWPKKHRLGAMGWTWGSPTGAQCDGTDQIGDYYTCRWSEFTEPQTCYARAPDGCLEILYAGWGFIMILTKQSGFWTPTINQKIGYLGRWGVMIKLWNRKARCLATTDSKLQGLSALDSPQQFPIIAHKRYQPRGNLTNIFSSTITW